MHKQAEVRSLPQIAIKMFDILVYIVVGVSIALYIMTAWMTVGLLALKVLDGRFDLLTDKHRDAIHAADYDEAARISDRMSTVAGWTDRVERLTFMV